jgi:hypothetical protein
VPNARSTRPFACGLFAQMMSMFRSDSARPNWVMRSPPAALAVHPKDAVFVAIESDRLAMRLQVIARRAEVIERGFRGNEPKLHQSARGIVHERQKRAHLATTLEPGVFRTVDLHKLAQAFATPAWLMREGSLWRRSTQSPSAIIHWRSVSTPTVSPWRSTSFSTASVGPKSG